MTKEALIRKCFLNQITTNPSVYGYLSWNKEKTDKNAIEYNFSRVLSLIESIYKSCPKMQGNTKDEQYWASILPNIVNIRKDTYELKSLVKQPVNLESEGVTIYYPAHEFFSEECIKTIFSGKKVSKDTLTRYLVGTVIFSDLFNCSLNFHRTKLFAQEKGLWEYISPLLGREVFINEINSNPRLNESIDIIDIYNKLPTSEEKIKFFLKHSYISHVLVYDFCSLSTSFVLSGNLQDVPDGEPAEKFFKRF